MELRAPLRWGCVDFISDLHLQAQEMQTFTAWVAYMDRTAADAIFMLGDLFEVWVGDDVLADPNTFEARCAAVIARTSRRCNLYVMHGNRDFLMGSAMMQHCGATLIDDPTVLEFGGRRWLLAHGDAQCLDDVAYQQFRVRVRSPQWQDDFLSKPLRERQAIARQMRQLSETKKQQRVGYADVDTAAVMQLLEAHHANGMIHGHTHRPGRHPLGAHLERLVLSDWDLGADPPRAEVLRLQATANGEARPTRISPLIASELAD
jgi:UDP-2,3-diacylglucosamine hydrolase